MALNSSLDWRRGGPLIGRHTHTCVWKKSSDTFPFIRQHLSRTHPTGKLARLSLFSLVSTAVDRPSKVAKIDFCGSRAAGKIKNSNDDSHLNPSFFYYIDNSTKHCAHTMLLFFIRPPAVLHHQPQSEQFFWLFASRSMGTSRAIVTIVWASRCHYQITRPREHTYVRFSRAVSKRSNQSTERRQIWNSFWRKKIFAQEKQKKKKRWK